MFITFRQSCIPHNLPPQLCNSYDRQSGKDPLSTSDCENSFAVRYMLERTRKNFDDTATNGPSMGPGWGTHTKLYIVDDVASVGSQNFYHCNLHETTNVYDSPNVAKQILEDFYNPIWHLSEAPNQTNRRDADLQQISRRMAAKAMEL